MVSGGEHVPAERVPTWVGAVRETILERYEATLIAYGQAPLLDPRLMRAFEIEAECRALIYASRELPTWSAVPDAGLIELLTRW
jgi:predicted trehalose synthase